MSARTCRKPCGFRWTTSGTPTVPGRTIRTGVCGLGKPLLGRVRNLTIHVGINLVDGDRAVAVSIGMPAQCLVEPVAEQRLLLLLPDLALLFGGRAGQGHHAAQVLKGRARDPWPRHWPDRLPLFRRPHGRRPGSAAWWSPCRTRSARGTIPPPCPSPWRLRDRSRWAPGTAFLLCLGSRGR